MASDVFGTDTTFGTAVKGTLFKLVVGGGDNTAVGALVQNFSAQYARQINRIYELGSRAQSYVEGPSAGQLSLSQIVGPSSVVDEILQSLGDICNAEENTVTLTAGAVLCEGDDPTVSFHNAVATSTAIEASVGNFIIQKNVTVMFTSMSV